MDFTRKLFVKKIVPEFVRSEYPLFIEFIEKYYDYLDRKKGQLTNVVVTSPGKNYSSSPVVSFWILQNGYLVPDNKGASASAFVVNGRIEKIVVDSYGSNYSNDDYVTVIITDSTGTGAEAVVNIFSETGNINELTKQIINARDIDAEVPLFVQFLKEEYVKNIPKKLYALEDTQVELNKFIKFIKMFYNSVGIENSIKFLYRILFNTDVNVYYPKTDMLRVSDGKWTFEKILTVRSLTEDLSNYSGKKIISSGGTTAIIQFVTNHPSGDQTLYNLNITDNTNSFVIGQSIGLYNFSLTNINYSWTITDYNETEGYYINDDGHPSSCKKIQDSFYYQDFSYELQSDQTITEFKNLLETLIHPAGLKYFIRLNVVSEIELLRTGSLSNIDKEDNIVTIADRYIESESGSLGPRFLDIERNKFATFPSFYQDYIIPNITSINTTTSTLKINSNEFNDNAFLGYTAIIDTGATGFIRTVTGYKGATGVSDREITLDAAVVTSSNNSVRLIQNYRPQSVGTGTKTFNLVPYSEDLTETEGIGPDSNNTRNSIDVTFSSSNLGYLCKVIVPGGSIHGRTFTARALLSSNDKTDICLRMCDLNTGTDEVKTVVTLTSTPTLVTITKTFSVSDTSIIFGIDNRPIIGGTGDTGTVTFTQLQVNEGSSALPYELTGTATYPNIILSNYHIGATGVTSGETGLVYTGSTGIYDYSRIYITSGTGVSQSRIIEKHIGPYVYLESAFSTPPTTSSTYYIHPEIKGSTGIYTSFLESIEIIDGGSNYNPGVNTINITPPIDGVQATAVIGATGPTGNITTINITNPGFGYITTPQVTINGATGFGAIVYPVLSNLSSSYAGSVEKVSLRGGVYLNVPDILNKFETATLYCTVNNGSVTQVFIDRPGKGYVFTPTYVTYGGEGTGVSFSISINNGSVSNVLITNLGVEYYTSPLIKVQDPFPKIGEKIYQPSTGARGYIDYLDLETNTFHIFKDYNSVEFDVSPIVYNGIEIEVFSILGTYETKNKKTNVISDTVITSGYLDTTRTWDNLPGLWDSL